MTAQPLASESPDARQPRYLRRPAAETYLALPPGTLAKLAAFGTGPCMVRLGRRVRYDVMDLDCWMERNKVWPGFEVRTKPRIERLKGDRIDDVFLVDAIRAITRWLAELIAELWS